MTTGKKITLAIVTVLVAALIGSYQYVNMKIDRFITDSINHALDNNDTLSLHVGDVDVQLLRGMIYAHDVELTIGHDSVPDFQSHLSVMRVKAGRLDLRRLFREKTIVVSTVEVSDVNLELSTPANYLWLQVEDLSVAGHDLGYNLRDSLPLYNDSCYSLSVGSIRLLTPDSLMYIETHDIHTADRGPIYIGQTRIRNTVDRWALGPILGIGPHNWIDLTLESARTSAIDIPALALTAKEGVTVDSLYATLADMQVFTDLRSKSEVPLPMPQEALMKLPVKLEIKHIAADIHRLDCEIAMTDHNSGTLHLRKLSAKVAELSTIQDKTLRAELRGMLGRGKVHAIANLTNNETCTWSLDLEAKEANLDCMNDFVHPLMAIEVGGNVHSIQASYGGDNKDAKGTFCMLYDSLTAHVDDQVEPAFHIIHTMGPLINSMVKTCIPHANPRKEGTEPHSFVVEWKRDEYRPAPLFLVGPTINGIIKTLLPGLFVRSEIKQVRQEELRKERHEARRQARAARREARREAFRQRHHTETK